MRRRRETGDGIEREECGTAGPRRRQALEKEEELLVRNGICLSLEEMMRATDTGGTSSSLQTR